MTLPSGLIFVQMLIGSEIPEGLVKLVGGVSFRLLFKRYSKWGWLRLPIFPKVLRSCPIRNDEIRGISDEISILFSLLLPVLAAIGFVICRFAAVPKRATSCRISVIRVSSLGA